MRADKEEIIKFTKRFCIKPTFGFTYHKKTKCDNDTIIYIDS